MSRWLVCLATGVMLVVNALSNAIPLGGRTQKEISDQFDIAFTPPGWVFSIWGLIYIGVIAFSIHQARSSLRNDPVLRAIRPWYLLNTAANVAWLFAWHYGFIAVSWALMLLILGTLTTIYARVSDAWPHRPASFAFVRAPFALYMGWISIATIANTLILLWAAGLREPLADPTFTFAVLTAATAICVAVAVRWAEPVYAIPFVWAFIGIGMKQADAILLRIGAPTLALVCAIAGVLGALALRRAGPAGPRG